ncbi:MAG: hypothetical protein K8H85_02290 [Cyclobacteriaceae bacterium]|nr:hypothetical protein [Cyclobacteriaceae bacterium]
MNKISRRKFTRLAAALSVAPYFSSATAQARLVVQPSSPATWPGYDKAIVILSCRLSERKRRIYFLCYQY